MEQRYRDALMSAQAAVASLPHDTPDWLRARDIEMQAQAELDRDKKEKKKSKDG